MLFLEALENMSVISNVELYILLAQMAGYYVFRLVVHVSVHPFHVHLGALHLHTVTVVFIDRFSSTLACVLVLAISHMRVYLADFDIVVVFGL